MNQNNSVERTAAPGFAFAIRRVTDAKYHGEVVSVCQPELFTQDRADLPSHGRCETSFTRMIFQFLRLVVTSAASKPHDEDDQFA